jgi:hypothetical protein
MELVGWVAVRKLAVTFGIAVPKGFHPAWIPKDRERLL